MAINQNNLFSESFSIIKNFLKDSISDPRNRFKSHHVHSSMPRTNEKGFDGYPFIIIRNDVSEDSSNRSFDGRTSNKMFKIQLRIMSDQSEEIDTISDEIGNKFNDELFLSEFHGRELASSPIDWSLDENGRKVLFRNIGLIFQKRI